MKHWINRACKSTGRRLDLLEQVDLVDLCPALLEQARRRTVAMRQVRVTEADVGRWLPNGQADVVYFSYSLTMMPNWRAVIDSGLAMLRPCGTLGVVDPYVSAAPPARGRLRNAAATCRFWPKWLAHDGVHLDPAHLALLSQRLPWHELSE